MHISTFYRLLIRSSWNELTHLFNLLWCKSFYFKIPTYRNFLTPKILKKCDPILVTRFLRNPSGYWLRDWQEMQWGFPTVIPLLTFRFKCLKNNITWQNKLLWKIVLQLQKLQNFYPYFYSRICIHLTKKHPPQFLLGEGEEGSGTEGDRSERWRKKSSSWEKYPPVPSTSAGTNKKEYVSGGGRN